MPAALNGFKGLKKLSLLMPMLFMSPFYPTHASTDTIAVSAIDWCPFICPDSTEKPGILVEYSQEIFRRAGIDMKHKIYSWSRAIQNVESGRSDAILSPAKHEAPGLVYPKSNIGAQRFCFFTTPKSEWSFTSPQDVSDVRLAYPRNTLTPEIAPFVNQETSREISGQFLKRAFKSLYSGKADVVYFSYYSTLDLLNKTQKIHSVRLAGCIERSEIYLAFSPNPKNTERSQRLMSAFETGIASLSDNTFINSLLKKYQLDSGFTFQSEHIASPWD